MTETFEHLRNIANLAEAEAAFGDFLGLGGPAPAAALRRAFADQYYRHNLILNRNRPQALQGLLQHPLNREFEHVAEDDARAFEGWEGVGGEDVGGAGAAPLRAASSGEASRSNAELAAKAGKALFEWAKTGFAVLDQAAFEARFSACERCDRLSDPPEKLVYALTRSKRSDPRICNACGCTAARKARLTSETCPLPDSANPGLTRWGEPIRNPRMEPLA